MSNNPTILQVLPALNSGGVERGTIEMAGTIASAGWHSMVASAGGGLVNKLIYAGADHMALPLNSKNPFIMWDNSRELEKIIREHNVSLVHARSRAPAWSAYFAAKNTQTPFLTTFHGIYSRGHKLKNFYNSIMTRGERVIAISNFTASHIRENYNLPDSKIVIIPRGVDLNSFDPAAVNQRRVIELITKWRIPDDQPVILMPGRITRWKGHTFLIDELAALPHKNYFCAIIGSDEGNSRYHKELENMILQKGLGENVRFVGLTDDMPAAYTMAHMVVVPSMLPEAFGRISIEAQAMGKPVIATNHGGAAETVRHKKTGLLVEPGNVQEFADAINEFLNLRRHEIDEVAVNGVNHVRANYSASEMCARELALYKSLIR